MELEEGNLNVMIKFDEIIRTKRRLYIKKKHFSISFGLAPDQPIHKSV